MVLALATRDRHLKVDSGNKTQRSEANVARAGSLEGGEAGGGQARLIREN
jgi:hypothetical protein